MTTKEKIGNSFGLFDLDKTGNISLANLTEVAKEIGEDMTSEELQEMLSVMNGGNVDNET